MIYHSNKSPFHSSVAWIYATFFISLVDLGSSSQTRRLFQLKCAQFVTLLIYFLAGLWKLREFIGLLLSREKSLIEVSQYLPSSVASKMMENQAWNYSGLWFMSLPSTIHGLAWIMAMIIQLGAIFFIFKDSYLRLIGIVLITFHLGAHLLLKITFTPMMFLLLVLFFISPFKKAD